jgi:hypothetical protein
MVEISNKLIAAIVILAILGTGVGFGFKTGTFANWFAPATVTPLPLQQIIYVPGAPTVVQPTPGNTPTSAYITPTPTNEVIPVDTLKAASKNKYTMAAIGTGDQLIKAYTPGADVKDPYTLAIDQINVSGSTNSNGTSSSGVITTGTPYDWYFTGDSAYYDEKLDGVTISYNKQTGKGVLLFNNVAYYSAVPFGTFVNQDTLPEVQSGFNDTTGNGLDTASMMVFYDKSSLGGSGWIKLDIGNSASNSALKDVVMCFRDSDGDMENNEITALTASYVSGSTSISIPPTLLQYWQDAMGGGASQCIVIADELGSSEQARWRFDFTVDETNFLSTKAGSAGNESFDIYFDDLGDYLAKEYPSRNAKATADGLTFVTQD